MNKLSRVELQAQDGIIPDLHPNKQMKTVILGMLEPICMYAQAKNTLVWMIKLINKEIKFNQFLIDKTNYQVHAPTETKQSLITMKLTKP